MELVAQHDFPAPPDAVIAAMLDPTFYAGLELPDIGSPEVLDCAESAGSATIRVRYEYAGTLDPLARTVLGTDRISWVQTLAMVPAEYRGTLTIEPGVQAGRVTCSGVITLEAVTPGTHRRIDGTLRIALPLVGGRAERAIAPGILRRLDIEGDAITRFLADAASR